MRAVLLLKAPRLGFVKTRLAASIGDPSALEIYQKLVEWQLEQIPESWKIDIHFAPLDAKSQMIEWLSSRREIRFFPQSSGDLGARLYHAATLSLTDHEEGIALMGGDCPDLSRAYLEAALKQFIDQDLVIAPCTDGGYALLMLRTPIPSLFSNIEWSTSQVLTQTCEAASKAGLRSHLLPPVTDIDDEMSLREKIDCSALTRFRNAG